MSFFMINFNSKSGLLSYLHHCHIFLHKAFVDNLGEQLAKVLGEDNNSVYFIVVEVIY